MTSISSRTDLSSAVPGLEHAKPLSDRTSLRHDKRPHCRQEQPAHTFLYCCRDKSDDIHIHIDLNTHNCQAIGMCFKNIYKQAYDIPLAAAKVKVL